MMYKGRFTLKLMLVRGRLRVGVDEIITTALHEVHRPWNIEERNSSKANDGKQCEPFVPF